MQKSNDQHSLSCLGWLMVLAGLGIAIYFTSTYEETEALYLFCIVPIVAILYAIIQDRRSRRKE